jgi:hypothetical protein
MQIERAGDVVGEEVDGRVVLFDPAGMVLLTLNGTGSIVWSALTQPRPPSVLVDEVLARHPDAERAAVTADVERFLGELRERGLIADARG